VPQILQALPWAIDGGLRLPIVYNTSCYDSLDSLALMDGIVDIYLPDLKVWTPQRARRYLRMPGYPQVAQAAVTEMNRQVGPLRLGGDGLARRGLLVRHLVMPGMLEETREILRFVAAELGTGTYVDLMAQYHPAGLVGNNQRDGYHEIDRQLARDEYELAIRFAGELGLTRLDRRSQASGLQLPPAPAPAGTRWQPGRRTTTPTPRPPPAAFLVFAGSSQSPTVTASGQSPHTGSAQFGAAMGPTPIKILAFQIG